MTLKKILLLFASVHLGLINIYPQWTNFRGNQQLHGFINEEIPFSLSILWTFKTEGEIKSSPVTDGSKIIIGSTDGNLYCFDFSGKLKWKYKTDNAIEASPLILNKNVYIGNLSGNLYSINIEKGTLNWQYQTEGQIMGGANWWTDKSKTYILVGSYDYYLHCVDAATGRGLWKYESNNYINGAVSIYQNTAIFGGCDGFLHVVDVTTGKAKSTIEIATYVAGSASLESGKAYIGDYDGGFSCVDINQKKVVWKWSHETTKLPFIASPAMYKDKILIGNRDKFIYCFDKVTGKLLWKVNSGNRVDASALVTPDKVLTTNMRGDIIVLNLSDGKTVWSYETGSPIYSNPLIAKNLIVFGAQDGNVYCLGKKK